MILTTLPSRQSQERHRDCSQDIVIHYHSMTLFIIEVSLERLTIWNEDADQISVI
jgi:hypothetical protein